MKVSTKRSIMTQTETAAKKTAAKKTSAVKAKADATVTTPPEPAKTVKPAAKKKSGLAFPFTAIVGQEEMKLSLILNIIDPRIWLRLDWFLWRYWFLKLRFFHLDL